MKSDANEKKIGEQYIRARHWQKMLTSHGTGQSFVVESPPRGKQLSIKQIKEKQLPHNEHSVWFHRQQDAFDYVQPHTPTPGYVSYDQRKTNGKISKVYAVFISFASYFKAEDELKKHQKNGCELIRSDHPCRLYSDVEWTIKFDLSSERQLQFEDAVKNADAHMAIWLQSLKHQLETYFGVDSTHIVLTGSRIKSDAAMKMSYHVIIENLAFTCNHDGAMQAVFESVPFPNMPGVTKNPIDLLVYTPNRNIRMIGCGKLSEPNNSLLFHPGLSSSNVLNSKLDTLLTYNIPVEIIVDANDLSNFPNFAQIYKKPSSNKVPGHVVTTTTQRAAASSTDRSQTEHFFPALQELMEIKGDKKTKVASFNGYGNNGDLKFQCINPPTRRDCQCLQNNSHLTNNCLLVVRRDIAKVNGQEIARVNYVCMSGKCKPRNICTLGHISSPDGHHWTTEIPLGMEDIAKTDGLDSTTVLEVEPQQSDDENISDINLAELDRTIMMEVEMQPPIGISTRERCSLELCLMASFPLGDPRTEKVFSALKSLDPRACGQDYFPEWCSRNPNIDMTDATKMFDDASPYNGDAKLELHRIRMENPAVVYLESQGALMFNGDLTKEKAKEHAREWKAKEKQAMQKARDDNRKKKKMRTEKCEGEMGMADDQKIDTSASMEKAEPNDGKMRKLYAFLHSVDFTNTDWRSLLSVVYQIFCTDEEAIPIITNYIVLKFKVAVPSIQKAWCIKHGPCRKWPEFICKHFLAACSNHKLITETIPEICGFPVFCYDIIPELDCTVLRVTLDNSAYTQHDLNLTTGYFDNVPSQSLQRFGLITMGARSIADFLLGLGLGRELGVCGEEFHKYQPKNGKWQQIDEKHAHRFLAKKIYCLFSRCLNLFRFRYDHSIPQEGKAIFDLEKAMHTFCETPKGVADVLHFIRPEIEITPDRRPYMVCFENGMVDLRTGKLLGPADPSDYVLQSIPHPFDPDADQTLMVQYLRSMCPKILYPDSDAIISFFQMHLGACLIDLPVMPAMLNFIGEGSNGKTNYLKLLSKSLGPEYHGTIQWEALAKPPCENNDSLYAVRSARSATITEFDARVKANGKQFKNLTGGDPSFFMGKFKPGENKIKHLTIQTFSNIAPTFTESLVDDHALTRRSALFPTRVQFLGSNDDVRRAKLIREGHEDWIAEKDEAFVANVLEHGTPAFLAFAVEGAKRLLALPSLDIEMPPTIRDATEREYCQNKSELLEDFVKLELKQSPHSFISTAEIIEVYKRLYNLESCLNRSSAFASQLKTLINGAFAGIPGIREDCMVAGGKKKVDTPEGRKEVRGYFNVDWVEERQAAGIAAKLRETYLSS